MAISLLDSAKSANITSVQSCSGFPPAWYTDSASEEMEVFLDKENSSMEARWFAESAGSGGGDESISTMECFSETEPSWDRDV
ncbi:hypothetical protein QG37_04813 [Candidozyma auris]|nr:hypothetical protein QG37_04813 [[Candida] auris]